MILLGGFLVPLRPASLGSRFPSSRALPVPVHGLLGLEASQLCRGHAGERTACCHQISHYNFVQVLVIFMHANFNTVHLFLAIVLGCLNGILWNEDIVTVVLLLCLYKPFIFRCVSVPLVCLYPWHGILL